MRRGFPYPVVIIDLHTRKALGLRISNALETSFCVEALKEPIHKFGPSEIMNTGLGSHVKSCDCSTRLLRTGVRILMDRKGPFLDNIVIERLWRILRRECAHLHAWEGGSDAKAVRLAKGEWRERFIAGNR